MLAVIKTGGKQYIVKPGDKIKIEKIEGKAGKEINFKEVLLLDLPAGRQGKNKKLEIGSPFVKGSEVLAKIIREGRGDKVIVFKHKSKIRYKVKRGHRQHFTEVEIEKINL
jgi:large subunit ribosomal protein L21